MNKHRTSAENTVKLLSLLSKLKKSGESASLASVEKMASESGIKCTRFAISKFARAIGLRLYAKKGNSQLGLNRRGYDRVKLLAGCIEALFVSYEVPVPKAVHMIFRGNSLKGVTAGDCLPSGMSGSPEKDELSRILQEVIDAGEAETSETDGQGN